MATPPERRLPRSNKKKSKRSKGVDWGRWGAIGAAVALVIGLVFGVWVVIGKVRSGAIALPSNVPYSIARETTWVTEPLTRAGEPDYLAYVNQKASQGITKEDNLAVVISQLGGSGLTGSETHAEFVRLLGVPVEMKGTSQAIPQLGNTDMNQAIRHPWFTAKHPDVILQLRTFKTDLDRIVDAAQTCNSWYEPLVYEPEAGGLPVPPTSGVLLNPLMNLRVVSEALSARAMNATAELRLEDAIRDALAVLKMGRMVSRGSISMEILSGKTIEGHAISALCEAINTTGITLEQLDRIQTDLDGLVAPHSIIPGTIDVQRIFCLDASVSLRREGVNVINGLLGLEMGESSKSSSRWTDRNVSRLDYNVMLRKQNSYFDRLNTEVATKTLFSERKQALATILAEAKSLSAAAMAKAQDRTADSEGMGALIASQTLPSDGVIAIDFTRDTQIDLLKVAVALRVASLKQHPRPSSLEELLGDQRPRDRFTGGELIVAFDPGIGRFRIYARGQNLVDDGGVLNDFGNMGQDQGIVVKY